MSGTCPSLSGRRRRSSRRPAPCVSPAPKSIREKEKVFPAHARTRQLSRQVYQGEGEGLPGTKLQVTVDEPSLSGRRRRSSRQLRALAISPGKSIREKEKVFPASSSSSPSHAQVYQGEGEGLPGVRCAGRGDCSSLSGRRRRSSRPGSGSVS